jgi:hypothetical protein
MQNLNPSLNLILFTIICCAILSIPVYAGPIEDLKPGEWYEVPNSHLQSVAYQWPAGSNYTINGVGFSAVIGGWSGGAYDTKRDRLIVWGGGHYAYGGNEIYVFDVNTLQWERINDPSNPPAVDVDYASDGGPCARHTYDYVTYLPNIDRFCTFGGAGYYGDGQHGGNRTDCFDFDTKQWERKSNTPVSGIGAYCAYDPATGNAFVRGTISNCFLAKWNPTTDTWTSLSGNDGACYEYFRTAAIDPTRNIFTTIGGGDFLVWNIGGSGNVTNQQTGTSGETAILGASNPGFAYDPVSDNFIAWRSGRDIYALDMDTRVWTRTTGTGANPGSPNGQGTFGRFRYIPSKNAFIVVNDVDANVFIYKHTAAASAPAWYMDMLGLGSAVQAGQKKSSMPGLTLSAQPNPFNTAVVINVKTRQCLVSTINIYNTSGRMVHHVKNVSSTYTWRPAGLPAGLYLAKVNMGTRTLTKRLFLIK